MLTLLYTDLYFQRSRDQIRIRFNSSSSEGQPRACIPHSSEPSYIGKLLLPSPIYRQVNESERFAQKGSEPRSVSKCHPFPFEFLTSREVYFHSSPGQGRLTKDRRDGCLPQQWGRPGSGGKCTQSLCKCSRILSLLFHPLSNAYRPGS